MQLYAGMSEHFIRDTAHNQIADKLKDAFFRSYRYHPSPTEVSSWRNSLRAVSQVFQEADLTDHGVILEYRLPLTSRRLDCLICGQDHQGGDNAVIIELKQWERCGEAAGEHLVSTRLGGAERDTLHPSAQVGQYQRYLQDTHTAFYDGASPVGLRSCAYLHNYASEAGDPLFADRFRALVEEFPAFTADDVEPLQRFLLDRLQGGNGNPVLRRIEDSKYRPSKKLMEHVGRVIKGKQEYVLLDEQLVVYDKVISCARKGFHDSKKAVLIVRGGPGTGKSVIALNLMSDLMLQDYNAHYATGSRAFTETLRKIIGTRGGVQFKYFNSYMDAEVNAIDVLICDEAHRIRKNSNSLYTKKEHRTDKPQIQELIDAAKVSVFFIDDNQVVRPDEIGSARFVREQAERSGCRVYEHELEAQFRCAGSDGFVNWVNNTLGIRRTANVLWEGDDHFEFRIFGSPEALEEAIRAKVAEGDSARMTAGFCWKWSKKLAPDGTLVKDVTVGSYERPWNAPPEMNRLPPGVPKATLWAHDPNGIDQVGCVYTAQGFEFDYAGVIFGPDLTYDFDSQAWKGHRENSHDGSVKRSGDRLVDLVKNTYRVLLSRGLKGCYVHFIDKNTERFVRSRIEADVEGRIPAPAKEPVPEHLATLLPFRILPPEEARPFENSVPLYELKAAAGLFSEEQQVEPSDVKWVELPDAFRPHKDLFVAQVVGESMNRRIPNGSWCLFRLAPGGTRDGKVVLVQHREIWDAEAGGHFTVKVYRSEKEPRDGSFRHKRIVLWPDTSAAGYEAIVLGPEAEGELRVIAELVAVLG